MKGREDGIGSMLSSKINLTNYPLAPPPLEYKDRVKTVDDVQFFTQNH